MKNILVFLVLASLFLIVPSHSEAADWNDIKGTSDSFKTAYFEGVNDALVMVEGTEKKKYFCASGEVTLGQQERVAIKYLQNHPEEWHFTVASVATYAWKKAYPCKN